MYSSNDSDSVIYFAFGSNMSEPQMRERCPSAERVEVGFVPKYELVFNRKGSYRPGGVASIAPSDNPERSVYGIIWRLSTEDLQELDRIEDPNAYERVTINARSITGQTYKCQAYLAYPEADYVAPDPEYLKLLLHAAREAGLPERYVQWISRFKHDA